MGTVSEAASGSVATGGASCTPAVPAGITSGDMLVCKVSWVNSTMVKPTMPGDWTELVSGSGGSATAGNNTGGRGVSIFYKETDGTDSGTVTVTSGSSTNAAITARITAYDLDAGTWDLVGLIASDTSAGTSYSITPASDPGLADGDYYFCVTAYAPRANTPSSPSLTWTGATFTGPNLNGSTANTNGWDVRQVNYDGAWSSGTSSAAPTFGFTASASIDGGTSAFVRLRAFEGGVEGTAAAAIAVTATVAGVPTTPGTAAATVGTTATAQGVPNVVGQAAASVGVTATASGTTATPPVEGTAAAAIGVTATASGLPTTLGTGAAAVATTATATGTPNVVATAAAPVAVTATVSGTPNTRGAAASSVATTATAAGVPTVVGQAASTVTVTATASGTTAGVVQGSAAASIGTTATVVGVRSVSGTGAATVVVTTTATGTPTTAGTAAASVAVTATVAGTPNVVGQAAVSVAVTGTVTVVQNTTPLGAVVGAATTVRWAGDDAGDDQWAGGAASNDLTGGI